MCRSILLFLFFLSGFHFNALAQVNLVPNPSFEDTVFCPFLINQVQAATNWENWGETPELFNACASGSLNVPNTGAGFQWAHRGQSMAGLITFAHPNGAAGPNVREYIGCSLLQSLIPGERYYVSYYINQADYNGGGFATNNIGLRFSTVQFSAIQPYQIMDSAHVNYSNLANDSVNWLKCSGSFVADSAYSFICLGNFYSDSLTTVYPTLPAFANYGYYFIDDVCVTTDSLYNELWTYNANEIELTPIDLFPNPFQCAFTIRSKHAISTVNIYNLLGQELSFESMFSKGSDIHIRLDDYQGLVIVSCEIDGKRYMFKQIAE
jgi:hypothetical protein